MQSDWPAQDREEPSPLVIADGHAGCAGLHATGSGVLPLAWSELMEGVGGTVFAVLMLAVAGALLRRSEQAFRQLRRAGALGLGLGLLLFKLGLKLL